MSEIVLGVGASHSTLMHRPRLHSETQEAAERYETALSQARQEVIEAGVDAAVVVGTNHFRGLWLDLLPTFTVGVGECTSLGEAGTPKGPVAVDIGLARHLCASVVADGFDVALSLRLQVDHGISHAVQYLINDLGISVVPILVNVFAPPLPSLRRCDDFGQAIARAVVSDGMNKRVVVIGSGGLSHQLPFPKWDRPETEGERFMVEAWLEGRGRWEEYDARRRSLTLATEPRINAQFDRSFLEMVEGGQTGRFRNWSSEHLEEIAGNGGHEIRTWLIASAATGHPPARRLSYDPIVEWLTGMAVAVMEPLRIRPRAEIDY